MGFPSAPPLLFSAIVNDLFCTVVSKVRKLEGDDGERRAIHKNYIFIQNTCKLRSKLTFLAKIKPQKNFLSYITETCFYGKNISETQDLYLKTSTFCVAVILLLLELN